METELMILSFNQAQSVPTACQVLGQLLGVMELVGMGMGRLLSDCRGVQGTDQHAVITD